MAALTPPQETREQKEKRLVSLCFGDNDGPLDLDKAQAIRALVTRRLGPNQYYDEHGMLLQRVRSLFRPQVISLNRMAFEALGSLEGRSRTMNLAGFIQAVPAVFRLILDILKQLDQAEPVYIELCAACLETDYAGVQVELLPSVAAVVARPHLLPLRIEPYTACLLAAMKETATYRLLYTSAMGTNVILDQASNAPLYDDGTDELALGILALGDAGIFNLQTCRMVARFLVRNIRMSEFVWRVHRDILVFVWNRLDNGELDDPARHYAHKNLPLEIRAIVDGIVPD